MEKSEPKSCKVDVSYLRSRYDNPEGEIRKPHVDVLMVKPNGDQRSPWFSVSIGPVSFYFESIAAVRETLQDIDAALRKEVLPS